MFNDKWDPDPFASTLLIAILLAAAMLLLAIIFEAITGVKIKGCC